MAHRVNVLGYLQKQQVEIERLVAQVFTVHTNIRELFGQKYSRNQDLISNIVRYYQTFKDTNDTPRLPKSCFVSFKVNSDVES